MHRGDNKCRPSETSDRHHQIGKLRNRSSGGPILQNKTEAVKLRLANQVYHLNGVQLTIMAHVNACMYACIHLRSLMDLNLAGSHPSMDGCEQTLARSAGDTLSSLYLLSPLQYGFLRYSLESRPQDLSSLHHLRTGAYRDFHDG